MRIIYDIKYAIWKGCHKKQEIDGTRNIDLQIGPKLMKMTKLLMI